MKTSHSNESPEDFVYKNDPNDADPMWYAQQEALGLLNQNVEKIEEIDLVVSSSMIKDLMYNGTEIEYCPNFIYNKYVLGTDCMKPSEAMIKGSFAETLLLGGSARGGSTDDLPRKRNGSKTIDQERIEIQVMNAENIIQERCMNLLKGRNTQVVLYKMVNGVLCRGELDWFPTRFLNDENELENAIIDIKFTSDLDTIKNFQTGEALWGDFYNMDDTQALMYKFLVEDIDWSLNTHIEEKLKEKIISMSPKGFEFYFWVFDYKKNIDLIQNKFFHVTFTAIKRREIIERIRKTKSIFDFHTQMNDWEKKIPCKTCSNCILECELKNKIVSK